MKKYILHPESVLKRNGEINFVSRAQLMRLYNLRPEQCISANKVKEYTKEQLGEMIQLYPKINGIYPNLGEN